MTNAVTKLLVAQVRSYDNQPVPLDIKGLRRDFNAMHEACEVFLTMKIESYFFNFETNHDISQRT